LWCAVSTVLAVCAAVLVVVIAGGPDFRPNPNPPAGPSVPLRWAPGAVPLELSIPAIGLSTSLGQVALRADATVAMPDRFDRAYWYSPGAVPGRAGAAVILGHVDSYRGPAVFYRLRQLRPGDIVTVALSDRSRADFVVRSVQTVLKRDFPAARVYQSLGDSELQLVTCGGSFDTTRRSYRSNVIVYTTLAGADTHTADTHAASSVPAHDTR
jgi:LPXTG-site transpeptidase (sortase) family protein